MKPTAVSIWIAAGVTSVLSMAPANAQTQESLSSLVGRELSVTHHLGNGQEFRLSIEDLIAHGKRLFEANWTAQEGAGRPFSKGTGSPLSDQRAPLDGLRSFNRISGPDSNSCAGCHNAPFGIAGGGGDFVTNVFVLAQRFDFVTFDANDTVPTRGARDENGAPATLDGIADPRSTVGMFGSGYIEMLARQMTADLQRIRDSIAPGGSAALVTKGVSFGKLARTADGTWVTSGVTGLPSPSLATLASVGQETLGSFERPTRFQSVGSALLETTGSAWLLSTGLTDKPSLIVRPFHQAGNAVSIRQFSNTAFNQHLGIQTADRFGVGDPDGDGFTSEMTIADTTAVSVFQAVLPVPGRVIPNHPLIEAAVARGEDLFVSLGCVDCHVPYLELDEKGWFFTEPSPYNPPGNLRLDSLYVKKFGVLEVDLDDARLQGPRLHEQEGKVRVPAFTDLRLHDITSGPYDRNREPLDMQPATGSATFFAGNSRFITRKLWGMANEPPYFHHGQFTTIRQAVEAHAGEAQTQRDAYGALNTSDQNALIEFLKTLQVLPPDSKAPVVDEFGKPRQWRPFPWSGK